MSNMNRAWNNIRIVMFAIIVIMLIAIVGRTNAQPGMPGTSFTVSCESEGPARVVFLMQSDTVEPYTLSMLGTAPFVTSIPSKFDTVIGKTVLGWVDNSMNNIREIHFTDSRGFDGVWTFTPDYMLFCDHDDTTLSSQPTPEPDATAEPTYEAPICLASAIDSATGRAYCYDPSLNSGVIPLPPAPQ